MPNEKPKVEVTVEVDPLINPITLQVLQEVHERFRALHARIDNYIGLIDKKDSYIVELEAQLRSYEEARGEGKPAPAIFPSSSTA